MAIAPSHANVGQIESVKRVSTITESLAAVDHWISSSQFQKSIKVYSDWLMELCQSLAFNARQIYIFHLSLVSKKITANE